MSKSNDVYTTPQRHVQNNILKKKNNRRYSFLHTHCMKPTHVNLFLFILCLCVYKMGWYRHVFLFVIPQFLHFMSAVSGSTNQKILRTRKNYIVYIYFI